MSEDLGLKIATKEEAFWVGIKEAREHELSIAEDNIRYFKAIIKLAKQKIKDEQD